MTKIFQLLLFLPLILQAAEEDFVPFVPNDPPRRADAGVEYEPLRLADEHVQGQASAKAAAPAKIVRRIAGRSLVGRINLQLRAELLVPADSVRAVVQIFDETGDSLTVFEGRFDKDGRLEATFDGVYGSLVNVVLSGAPDNTDPLADFQINGIVLGSSPRIMLIGDSITDGKFADDMIGYRKSLYDNLTAAGQAGDFVGQYGQPPYEGHFQGGMKISDFYPSGLTLNARGRMDVTGAMNTYRPNIAAVHLGTNDLNSETGFPIAPYGEGSNFANTQCGELAALIDYLLEWHDGQRGTELEAVIVSLIIPLKYQDSVCVAFNVEAARLINDFRNGLITGREEPVYICDHFGRFREWPNLVEESYNALMYDTLHPNSAGHLLMGKTYFETIYPLLSGRQKWFTDITWYAGVGGYDHYFENQGIAVGDIDGDGRDDLYTSRTNSVPPNPHETLYQQDGSLPFIDRTAALHLEDNGASRGLVFFDKDNDGDLDLFNGNSSARNRLYENIGGDFRDITADAGIADLKRVTTGVVALDVENDGDMDMYAVNSREKNELYINQGNRFTLQDRGADDATEPDIPSMSVAAADFDQDGDVDIFIPKRNGANKLFVNNGAGRFIEGAASAGLALTASSNAAVFADMDGDGDLDLVLGLTRSNAVPAPNLVLYENKGDGTFANCNLSLPMDGYSPLAADFDNDGDNDILATQESDYAVLHRNDGAWRFTRVNDSGAEIHAGDVRGAAVLDDDDDGDLDIAATRADMFNVYLRNNLDNGYHFLKINANGPGGNAVGYGTKLWLYQPGHLNDDNFLMGYHEVQSTGGHLSQPSPTQHFGLKNFRQCDVIAQFTDGSFVSLRAVDADQTIELLPPAQPAAKTPALVSYVSGDGQRGTVGESLAEPLVVRVSDAEGRPMSGSNVAFAVVAGDAQLFLPNQQLSKIALVPEDGVLSGSARRVFDETCANQGFIFIPPVASTDGSAKIDKSVLNAGNYSLWLRTLNTGAAATIQVRIDGAEKTITAPSGNDWQWCRVGATASIYLSAASHTFEIFLTSAPLQIDQLLLTTEAAYQPTGLEEINEQPELTDDQGLARRFVQLNTQAGPGVIHATVSHNGAAVPNSPIVFNHQALSGPAVSMHENGGNHQAGRPDEPLAEPFVVTVLDAFGNRVANVGVTFSVQSGGGSLTKANTVLTNDNGRAENTLVPGAATVEQIVRAEATLTGSPILFYTTVAGLAQKVTLTSGGGQSAPVLTILPQPVEVRVLTLDNQPVANYTVAFTTQDENGRLSSSTTFQIADSSLSLTTNAQGYARVYWQLGKKTGVQRLTINAGTITGSPLTVSAQATAGPPALLLKIDGDAQTAVVQRALPQLLSVRLVDADGNPVTDFPVTFRSQQVDGTFSGKASIVVKTDAGGDASAAFTIGKNAGQQKIAEAQAELNGKAVAGSPAEFYATALADVAALAAKTSGDNQQGVVASVLQPFVVKITDAYGNPISGFTVNFTVLEGGGTLNGRSSLAVISDDFGLAQAVYQLGTTVGNQRVRALVSELTPPIIDFTASAVAGTLFRLTYVSGDSQQAVVNSTLPTPLRVRAVDENGASVAGILVTFSRLQGDGQFIGATETLTDETGATEISYHFGTKSGGHRIQAASPEYDEPVLFTLRALPEQAVRIRIAGGNHQTGVAGHPLNQKLNVQALDRFSNGVPSATVTFKPQQGHGVVTPAAAVADSNGVARAEWRLGLTAGEQFLFAAGDGLTSSPLAFKAEALPNQPPSIQLPDSLLIDENQLLTFSVSAADVENDSITIIAMNLPVGAAFDESGRLFTWKPDYTQAGYCTPAFYAVDHLGASSLRVLPIRVRNVNRPPVISLQDSRPLQHNLGQVKAPHTLDFSIVASDPDGDPLKYLWQVNEKRLSVGSSFRLNSQLVAAGATVVQVSVFDASDTVSTAWTLRIVSSVELTAFQGNFEPYTGVVLNWQTRQEWQNLGFIVERSTRADGPFAPVSALIPSDESGKYRFCDAEVDAEQVVFYRVTNVQADGQHNEHEAIRIQPPMPDVFFLHQNFPNPFNSSTSLRFELPQPAQVQVVIYDLLGRRTRLLLDAPLKPGWHTLAWDGRSDASLDAASGVYTISVTQNGQRAIKKMVVVR